MPAAFRAWTLASSVSVKGLEPVGFCSGYEEGYNKGKDDGYSTGYSEGKKTVQTTSSSSAGTSSNSNTTTTVYITKTGSKYHRSGCSYLRQSKIAISLSSAKAQGYTACSRCW